MDREGEGPARRQTDTMPGMVTTHYNREVAAKRMLNEDQQEKIFDLEGAKIKVTFVPSNNPHLSISDPSRAGQLKKPHLLCSIQCFFVF